MDFTINDVSDSSSDTSLNTSEKSELSRLLWIDSLFDHEIADMEENIHELIVEYIETEIQHIHLSAFHENMKRDIMHIYFNQLLDGKICTEVHYSEIEEWISEICDRYFEDDPPVPPRSHSMSFPTPIDPIAIHATLDRLRNAEQPAQRTDEWYKFRHNIITASNIWKVFGSEAQCNSLIFEKCQPLEPVATDTYINTNSPMHWGNKYEPVSVMLYEHLYKTTVGEFGCIRHPTYSCIGASPDGINIDPLSTRYGRMLEIKNIVNREITGIPKDEYWIQMQLQMETCDLDECDFLETRFKQYESREQFYADEFIYEHRGVILYFVHKVNDLANICNKPQYMYMPMDIPLEEDSVDDWIQSVREELREHASLYEIQYWYLEEMSCVLVKRNRMWFESSVAKILDTWKIIEKERVEGYDHRAAKKRVIKLEVINTPETNSQFITNLPITKNVCLIKLDEYGETL